jgi:DNA-binding HxlR family transcriptional regulator
LRENGAVKKTPRKRAAPTVAPRRSRCPVACTLDIIGDRWTLLVVRDLMRGKRRFAELVESPEHIPTNILADRLKRLVSLGVIQSRQYSDRPPRVEYLLTAKGEDLRPVMGAMVEWGVKHAGGRVPQPLPPRSDDPSD